MSTYADPKTDMSPDFYLDDDPDDPDADWLFVTGGPRPVAYFLDGCDHGSRLQALNQAARPNGLSRIIHEGRLRDSFELADCPRLARNEDNPEQKQTIGSIFQALKLRPPTFLRRTTTPRTGPEVQGGGGGGGKGPTPDDGPEDDGPPDSLNLVATCPYPNNNPSPTPGGGVPGFRRSRSLPASYHDLLLDPYPRLISTERLRDGSTVTTVMLGPEGQGPLVAVEGPDGGREGAKKPRRFTMSAIADCIRGMVGRDKDKDKSNRGRGDERTSAPMQQMQQQQEEGDRIYLLGEGKDEVVVSVEPRDRVSESSGGGEDSDGNGCCGRGSNPFLTPFDGGLGEERDGGGLCRRRSAGI